MRVYVSACVCFHVFWKEGDLRYHWSDENSLEITNVTRSDAGVYTVECSNDEGVNQTSITLDVQCKDLHTEYA